MRRSPRRRTPPEAVRGRAGPRPILVIYPRGRRGPRPRLAHHRPGAGSPLGTSALASPPQAPIFWGNLAVFLRPSRSLGRPEPRLFSSARAAGGREGPPPWAVDEVQCWAGPRPPVFSQVRLPGNPRLPQGATFGGYPRLWPPVMVCAGGASLGVPWLHAFLVRV